MSEPVKINWPGQSGTEYTHYIYPRGTKFKESFPGNYIHAKETKPGHWLPVYIGQTGDMNERLTNHEKKACVDKHGATHVHIRVNRGGEEARLADEADLIAKWQPPCNVQGIR